jgi:hypothetical protein
MIVITHKSELITVHLKYLWSYCVRYEANTIGGEKPPCVKEKENKN